MLKAHVNQSMIMAFLEDTMSDQELAVFIEHIENCSACYDELEVYYMINNGLMAMDAHPLESMDLREGLRTLIRERKERIARDHRRSDHHKLTGTVAVIILLIIGYYMVSALFSGSEDGAGEVALHIRAYQMARNEWLAGMPPREDVVSPEEVTQDPAMAFELYHHILPDLLYPSRWTYDHLGIQIELPERKDAEVWQRSY